MTLINTRKDKKNTFCYKVRIAFKNEIFGLNYHKDYILTSVYSCFFLLGLEMEGQRKWQSPKSIWRERLLFAILILKVYLC